jgi:hypothetical protein
MLYTISIIFLEMSLREKINFVEKSVVTFDEYYANCFDKATLIITLTNDLINEYFCGKIDLN